MEVLLSLGHTKWGGSLREVEVACVKTPRTCSECGSTHMATGPQCRSRSLCGAVGGGAGGRREAGVITVAPAH